LQRRARLRLAGEPQATALIYRYGFYAGQRKVFLADLSEIY